MKGIRHFLRDFTATAVREHLRSEIEAMGTSPELTKNEIELVRFICEGSADWGASKSVARSCQGTFLNARADEEPAPSG
jgi:hypothetical protein